MNPESLPPSADGLNGGRAPQRPATATGIGGMPKATWSVWEAVAAYIGAFLIGGLATLPILLAIGDADLAEVAANAASAVLIVVVLVWWLSTLHRTWPRILGFPARGTWWREIGASIGFGVLLYPAMALVVAVIVRVFLSVVSGEPATTPRQIPAELPPAGVAITVVYAIVIAPIHEELFFRGVLFRAVGDRWGMVAGLVVTGLGFGLIHYIPGPWEDSLLLMGVMVFNGMALGWWYARRGTIVASIVAHMVFNVIGLTLILALD
jgi:membrane protease YdiL (CAAX protease family)